MLKIPLQYDISELALKLNFYQDFVWLDSADDGGISILAFDATARISFTKDSQNPDFLEFLNQKKSQNSELPFCGGWIGYISYEAYQFNDLIPFLPKHFKKYPIASFRHYDTFVFIDSKSGESNFISYSSDAENKWRRFKTAMELPSENCKFETSGVAAHTQKSEYEKNFNVIKKSLQDGDYLELNFTQEFSCEFSGSKIGLYLKLRNIAHAPMMAFLKFPEVTILSASPERFFSVQDRHMETYPIKGTCKRGSTREEDEKLKKFLQESQKDQAELLMVTDMLRNDLGRICKSGSVVTSDFARIHTFSHYHHLMAKISGTLLPESQNSDIFRSLFPGGSITGAPKIAVMEHIQKLEDRARGVYTGAIGYLSDNGNMKFSIPIRTIVLEGNCLSFATGGGIVVDSHCQAEYEECMVKASALLETMVD